MALAIYELADPNTSFSVSGVFTNPIPLTFDGTLGGVKEKKYYVRNNSVSHTYAGIVLQPIDSSGAHLIDGTVGFSWKLSEGNTQPTEVEWATIDDGNSITLSAINDSNTYLPFWLRVAVPRATSVQSFDSVTLKITVTETLI